MLGLDPTSVLDRIKAAGNPVVLPNLRQSLTVGTIGFVIVSVVVFSLWAFAGRWLYQHAGQLVFYILLAVAFMAGGGGAFKPLLIGDNLARFYALFVSAFFLYAAVWIGAEGLMGREGEWVATFLGPSLMAMVYCHAFRAYRQLGRCVVALVIGHTAGYFLADWLFSLEPLKNRTGMLVWGIVYGVGFGLGLSYTLHCCQSETRERLLAAVSESPAASASGR